MRKRILALAVVTATAFSVALAFTGCNKQLVDTTYTYNYAYISCGDSHVTVVVDKWKDYDGEQIQITDTNGNVYLTQASNVVLIKK
jgi:hypothetical protein